MLRRLFCSRCSNCGVAKKTISPAFQNDANRFFRNSAIVITFSFVGMIAWIGKGEKERKEKMPDELFYYDQEGYRVDSKGNLIDLDDDE